MSIQMVLVGFVLHMVGGVYVAMLLAQTLLKLEDSASNIATRSQLAAWIDAVIRALCVDFANDMEPTIVAMSSIVQRGKLYVPLLKSYISYFWQI